MEIRDDVIGTLERWCSKAGVSIEKALKQLGISASKFYAWRKRRGQTNQHNHAQPRYYWLEEWEKEAILVFHEQHPNEGYRRLTYMMLDENVVAVSPSSVYRVLKAAGRLQKWLRKGSQKGNGFDQPTGPHQHWHIDISYININGTFYYLCTVLDGFSRAIIEWQIKEKMTETDVEIIVYRALEKHPEETPRIISDNGPQFIARDFKIFIREMGMTHVRTSPYYPQSNGKVERWHGTLKHECIRPMLPLNLDDAHRIVKNYVCHYNHIRLHSAIGYITPADMLAGRAFEISADRKKKLNIARKTRKHNQLKMRKTLPPKTVGSEAVQMMVCT